MNTKCTEFNLALFGTSKYDCVMNTKYAEFNLALFGTSKYDCVMNTREVFCFLLLIYNSVIF